MDLRFRQWILSTGLVAALMALPSLGMAQLLDSTDELTEPDVGQTPIEALAPESESDMLPGTEPLYDQGVTVTQIELEGNHLVPDEMIVNTLSTKPGSLYSKRRLQNDLKKLFELGYFTENLKAIPVATRDGIRVKYVVEENPPVNEVAFEGNTLVSSDEIKGFFAPQIGMPQNPNLINKAIQNIENVYQEKGYVLARVEDIQEPETGKIVLSMNEGKVNSISFSGNKKTKDFVIKRALAQKEGEVYNEKIVSEDLKRIHSIQAFSDIRRVIKASPEAPGEYDLVIEVDERKTAAISFGGGVDTGTGVFGSIGYSDPNFLGRGQNVSSIFTLGTGIIGNSVNTLTRRTAQAQISWFNPSIGESLTSIGTTLHLREFGSFNVPLGIERRIGGEVTVGRPLKAIRGLSYGTSLGVESTDVREGASQATLTRLGITPTERAQNLKDGTFAYLSPLVAFDSRNNRLNPTDGWLSTVSTRMAYGMGNDSYGTVNANLRRYLTITDNASFGLNVQGGGNMFGPLPQFDMFRMGGNYSIRGFQEGGVGVGENYILGSAEVRSRISFLKRFNNFYNLYDMLQAAVFVDAGRVFERPTSEQKFGRPGYGIAFGSGIRMTIPGMGPLRLDYAVPVGGNKGRQIRNINFGVGQKF